MIALADLHIGRLTLRGSATAIAHARATLPPALARARWPDEEAILVVRRIAVGGTGTELRLLGCFYSYDITSGLP